MKFKALKSLIESERITIFEVCDSFNIVRERNAHCKDLEFYDNYEVVSLSALGEYKMVVNLKKEIKNENI